MPSEKICKTVHQYSRFPIPEEDMGKLREIADDYNRVKNYVYARYGGVGSLSKLYPGYTVQNEMTESGFRLELGLPSVYFYLAVFEALGDIKRQWIQIKSKIMEAVGRHEAFTAEEKHYLRFLLRVSNAFEAVLNQKQVKLPKEIQVQYDRLAETVDPDRLNRYLCRQVRRYIIRPHTDVKDVFSISERAYRYGDCGTYHGIYIATKERRKRVFVSLTDGNQYKCQLHVRLKPHENSLEIYVPVEMAVREHADYTGQVGLALGVFTMLTTDTGHRYGTELGEIQTEYAEWIRSQRASYHRNCVANPGRKKYEAKKKRYTARLHGYINQELNCLFQTEKPRTIYIVKLPHGQQGGLNRKINNGIALWQKGYIRERLKLKCRERSVELVEVLGKDISRECSSCGAIGRKECGVFTCEACGFCTEEKINTAKNVLKRGQSGRILN